MPHAIHRLSQVVCRRFPLLSGRGTLVQWPPLKWLHFEEERLPVWLDNGYTLVVFPNDFIGKSVLLFGDVDPKVTQTLARLLDPGDALVDVGANIGAVAVNCLPCVGPGGRVVAVEPQPACCDALRETAALNRIGNLEIHPVALSDRAGRLELYLPEPDNLGTASLEAEPGRAPHCATVEVRHGGEFLESLGLRGEYVVKIDVEGHEGQVIGGFLPYFERHAPKAVVFESHAHKYQGQRFQDGLAYRLLTRLAGFRIFQIHKSLLVLTYSEVRDETAMPAATDFVALRPDQIGRLPKKRPRRPKTEREAHAATRP